MTIKKNILIVAPHKVGLTETFIRAHIERLDGQVYYLYGWNLEFYTKDDVSLKDLYSPKPGILDKLRSLLPHYFYFRLERSRQKAYTKEALIERYLKEHQIEVVLAEYGTAGSFMAPICQAVQIPLIVHFHGFDASSYDILDAYKKGYQLMFRVAKHIIVVSHAMAKALETIGCPKDKLVLNTYGPHPDYLNVEVNYNSDYLISVGRHTYKKAPYLTILAFQKVLQQQPQLHLKMIGDGELYEVSNNLIKSLGLEQYITLLGGLERQEIINHLQTGFLFVQHSLVAANGDSEGTPVGIIEAMAAGLPVISTRHAGIPDVVIENETGLLVDEGNINQMAERMLRLVKDRNLAKQMGLNGKARISEHFTLEKHLETLNRLIYNLV